MLAFPFDASYHACTLDTCSLEMIEPQKKSRNWKAQTSQSKRNKVCSLQWNERSWRKKTHRCNSWRLSDVRLRYDDVSVTSVWSGRCALLAHVIRLHKRHSVQLDDTNTRTHRHYTVATRDTELSLLTRGQSKTFGYNLCWRLQSYSWSYSLFTRGRHYGAGRAIRYALPCISS